MQARVKENSWIRVVTAFGGREYVGSAWRDVPAGCEDEARKNPLLDVSEPAVELMSEPVKKARRK